MNKNEIAVHYWTFQRFQLPYYLVGNIAVSCQSEQSCSTSRAIVNSTKFQISADYSHKNIQFIHKFTLIKCRSIFLIKFNSFPANSSKKPHIKANSLLCGIVCELLVELFYFAEIYSVNSYLLSNSTNKLISSQFNSTKLVNPIQF